MLGILCLLLFKTFPREENLRHLNIEQIQERISQEQRRGGYGFNGGATNTFSNNNSDMNATTTDNHLQPPFASTHPQSATGNYRFQGASKRPIVKMQEEVVRKKYSVCFMIYKIFQNVCLDNQANQEYLFKFMSEFQKQIGSQDIVCDSLIRCFKSNKPIL